MDVKDTGWFGRLEVSGHNEITFIEGSVMQMASKMIQMLSLAKVRSLAGGKRITITFSDRPIHEGTPTSLDLIPLDDQPPMGPIDGESYEQFYQRKLSEGVSPLTAEYLANDWFNQPQDTKLTLWLVDPKIARFNELNMSRQAYESALPSEYEQLKQYIQREYPERAKHITFKTA